MNKDWAKSGTIEKKNLFAKYANIGKGTAKNFLYLIASQGIYKILAFLTFIFIARYLGAEAFGQMSYALSFVAFFMLIADFGVSDLLIREAAGESQERRLRYIHNISTLKFFLALITFIAIISVALILRETKEIIITIAMFGLAMVCDSYTIFLKSIFRVSERMKYEAISIVFEGILKVALVFIIIKSVTSSVLIIAQAFLLVSVVTLIFTLLTARARFAYFKLCFDLKLWRTLFIGGTPFAVLIFFQVINFKIDTIMLSKMTDHIITGWFSAAARFLEPMLIIATTFTAAAFPVVSRLSKKSDGSVVSVYKASLVILTLISVLLGVILFLGADFYIPFLFGNEFARSALAVKMLCLALIPMFLRFFLDSFILALKRTSVLFFNYAAGTVINILINIILIPRFNFSGACIATILSEFSMVGFYIFWLKNNLSAVIKVRVNNQPVLVSPEY
jgi:O-antigen/teichoic acid export membrane protein